MILAACGGEAATTTRVESPTTSAVPTTTTTAPTTTTQAASTTTEPPTESSLLRSLNLLFTQEQASYEAENYEEALAACEEALEVYEKMITQFGEPGRPESVEIAGEVLVDKGLALAKLGRPEEAIVAYEEVITRNGDLADLLEAESLADEMPLDWGHHLAMASRVVWAYFFTGQALEDLGRPEEAIVAYEELITRFGDSDPPNFLAEGSWPIWEVFLVEAKDRVDILNSQ
jgi:tetratricopeptide (TPR) repeat protein